MSVPVLRAATVVLLRRGDEPLEVFLLERNHASGFVPGAHLFPGGALDEDDASTAFASRSTLDPDRANDLLDDPDGFAYWVAAIRETFEEAGLLLARRRSGVDIDFADPRTADRFAAHRREVDLGRRPFGEVCEEEDLTLSTDTLVPFSRWITPAGAPRRYDTRFFVTAAPHGQTASHDGVETIAGRWVSPHAALERHRAGEWPMIEPTVRTLEALTRFADPAEAIETMTTEPMAAGPGPSAVEASR